MQIYHHMLFSYKIVGNVCCIKWCQLKFSERFKIPFPVRIVVINYVVNEWSWISKWRGGASELLQATVQLRREQRSLAVLKAVANASLRALQRAKSGIRSWLRGWLVSLADFIVCTTRARRKKLVFTLVCSLLFSVSLSVLRDVYSKLKCAIISEFF